MALNLGPLRPITVLTDEVMIINYKQSCSASTFRIRKIAEQFLQIVMVMPNNRKCPMFLSGDHKLSRIHTV